MKPFRLPQFLSPLVFVIVVLTTANGFADEVKLQWQSSGATVKLGSYVPQHLTLSTTKPAGIKQLPPNLAAPRYGELALGPAESPTTFFVIVDEPEGKPSRLFVDANGNGDFTDDPPAEWNAKTNRNGAGKELVSYSGGATLQVPYEAATLALHVPMYRFDKADSQHGNVATMLFYYGDYARTGVLNVGGKFYQALLADRLTIGDFRPLHDLKRANPILYLDVNGDGKFDLINEAFRADKPFHLAGGLYEISGLNASGSSFQVGVAAVPAEVANAVAGLQKGNRAPAFEVATTAGVTVKFPEAYSGKLVMLDFWATWCPPCREEIPNIVAVYGQYHAQRFEILGVSLDQADAGAELSAFTQEHHMPWPQIYDGKYWQAAVAKLYGIESIPHAFLVDGDTGIILAEGDSLRGGNLSTIVSRELAKRHQK